MRKLGFTLMMGFGMFFSLCSFTSGGESTNENKDADVSAILKEMGISTSVDEAALEAKYPSVKVTVNSGSNIMLAFNNPTAQYYNLEVFDSEGSMVASYSNIMDAKVAVASTSFERGAYTYKLTGEGNTFAGKFFYQ
ncbi:MAG: hypothetical protein SFW35_00960 [Chitinophagales bacterium]|nr:hypothetical protein [Chitinophagales bacterium]